MEARYDPEGYRRRNLLKRLKDELEKDKHVLLLDLLSTAISEGILAIAQKPRQELALHLKCAAIELAGEHIRNK
jgi:hypothetical protein